ncbi:hypothetical protein INN71_03970 [Nocardioides sp. ChNu-153]|uniref:hypothetical protein n=1 Tax=unclassified Nocardioides TaxID=2615069 RepID=UPI0024071BCC|nr:MULTISPECIES: hypothetical protein [unclassified Nocardioides]MDF9716613.1 hypothetical protein [Nocardioides sp. ChNu-99]MDN7120546.1 hypothetical protein [Nocardioides sp. ChNu-153]
MTTALQPQTSSTQDRNTEMQLLNEELARAQSAELLLEAEQRHQVQRLVAARRLSRKAEVVAARARLKLARSL